MGTNIAPVNTTNTKPKFFTKLLAPLALGTAIAFGGGQNQATASEIEKPLPEYNTPVHVQKEQLTKTQSISNTIKTTKDIGKLVIAAYVGYCVIGAFRDERERQKEKLKEERIREKLENKNKPNQKE